MKKFGLIGASGYVAPKHLQAIRDNKGDLLAAYDPFDSVGVMDSYFPQADFFTEFERFERHLDKLRRQNKGLDFMSICSPNYLHDSHSRFALKNGIDVICEKPLALNPHNVEGLKKLELETGHKVFNILQLRLHPAIVALKKEVEQASTTDVFELDLTYITPRGHWYYASWKGDDAKSGGIATNIGIHFFDMLTWIFGDVHEYVVHLHTHDRASGMLRFKQAAVRWFLSINYETLPDEVNKPPYQSYRKLHINGKEIDFSTGFDDLHAKSYEAILHGKGFGITEALPAIQLVHQIRNSTPVGLEGDYHSFAKKPLSIHPFQMK